MTQLQNYAEFAHPTQGIPMQGSVIQLTALTV